MRMMTFTRFASIRARISDKFSMPDRLKGTVVEKWTNYWKGLLSDYTEVATGVLKEAKNKPKKALIIGSIGYGLYSCAQHNPNNEEALLCQLRLHSNRMATVTTSLQNPESVKYLEKIEEAINHNKLRLLSLGICTLLWIDLYDKDDCTYPAICDYTKVGYWNFHQRIADIGFWDRFWGLEMKMMNYDVNYL